MLTKVIESTSDWFGGEQVVRRLFDVDSKTLTKEASEVEEYIQGICPEEGKTKLLVIALGASEVWGSNRNADAFPEQALRDYYKTFEDFAHVHKHHKNKPHDTKYGKVEKAFWNDKMKRVELVIVFDNSSCSDILSKLDCGEDIAVSMAAKLPYDICSVCKHKRTTPKPADTCTHIKSEPNKIYEDGRQVYAINEKPRFFDISFVWRPADRTAYAIKKVASISSETVTSTDLAIELGFEKEASESKLNKNIIEKLAYIKKLGELEKRIKGVIAKKIAGRAPTEYIKVKSKALGIEKDKSISNQDIEKLQQSDLQSALAGLTNLGVILRPKEFVRVVAKKEDPTLEDKVQSLLPGIFSRLASQTPPDLADIFPVSDLDFGNVPDHALMRGLLGKYQDRTLHSEPAVRRCIAIMIVKKKPDLDVDVLTHRKATSNLEKEASEYEKRLAETYALYKAAALQKISSTQEVNLDNFTAVMGVLENYV